MIWFLELIWNVMLAAGILIVAIWASGYVKRWVEGFEQFDKAAQSS